MPHRKVKDLARLIVALFFDDTCMIIMDVFLNEKNNFIIRADVLADELHLSSKQVNKALNKLQKDMILDSYESAAKRGENLGKGVTYWFNHRLFIDAVKYKLQKMQDLLNSNVGEDSFDGTLYVCPKCQRTSNALDAQKHIDMETFEFICPRCQIPLQEPAPTEKEEDQSLEFQEKQRDFHALIDPISQMLQDIDELGRAVDEDQ
ncbi:putative transcription initiation factor TFIIE subunit alpha [Blattamonas nauphoetae]|uniref:Transcription initiation factor TFIIE subunit alpha n=1 Tax=Blattamonas nauphoetae TaxID=2049346 RepID=A0ABQ9YC57_9EUKA|nr:putative transcription initiation factor TFIIE subunit alpha [Blattamonas nauphoetae]